jgi:hypothetical protein
MSMNADATHKGHDSPDHRPEPGAAARTGPAPGPADLVPRRQLERSVSWSGCERLRCLWYRLRLTVTEMNYATRRMVELQAPWIADDRPAQDSQQQLSPPPSSIAGRDIK